MAVAVFLRDSSLFLEPRFWAEEGTHYFTSALQRSVVDGLLHVAAVPYAPYLHPIPALATVVAAHALPLEFAPYATVAAWTLALLALEVVVLFGRAELLDPLPARLLIALSPLIAVGSNENWVNSLGAHYYCDLAMVLLLLEAPRVEGRRRTVGLAAFAAFAFLSPTSWFVVPAVVGVSLARWRQTRPFLFLALGAVALQTVAHFACFEPTSRSVQDAGALPHLLLSKLLVWPLLGGGAADAYGAWAGSLAPDAFLVTSVVAAAIAAGMVVALLVSSRRDATTIALLVTWLSAVAGYLLLGLEVGRDHLARAFIGGRYVYFPTMLLLALLAHQLGGTDVARSRLRVPAFAALVFAMLLVGVLDFTYSRIDLARMHGQSWRAEVAHHRENPAYDHLRIAPPGWVVTVPMSAR